MHPIQANVPGNAVTERGNRGCRGIWGGEGKPNYEIPEKYTQNKTRRCPFEKNKRIKARMQPDVYGRLASTRIEYFVFFSFPKHQVPIYNICRDPDFFLAMSPQKTPKRISINSLNNTAPSDGSEPPLPRAGGAKIQHQFKSQEKLTLLQQVIAHNPYRNKRTGWQSVKNGYLQWKNVHRPKYADPAEDYIKRKVQEILRLYSRSGKDSLKENGFTNKDSPEAQLFLSLIEQVLALKNQEADEEDPQNHPTIPQQGASSANSSFATGLSLQFSDFDLLERLKRRKVSNPIVTSSPVSSSSGKKPRPPLNRPLNYGQAPYSQTPLPGLPRAVPMVPPITALATKIGELPVDEFMLLMNKNNQYFALTFAQEFTKSISETLVGMMGGAIKEAIQETTKNNLDIIKALRN